MYFEPVMHDGNECMDGGLRENNPIQIAINESKKIWGDQINFDIALSVGSGVSRFPPNRPTSLAIIPRWLDDLFTTLINSMNGEDQWKRYLDSQGSRLKHRSTRLNVVLKRDTEPELDDVKNIGDLEDEASSFHFFNKRPVISRFMPIPEEGKQQDKLMETADRLVGSLFFFILSNITQTQDTYAIRGSICCRLGPGERGFDALMRKVQGFKVRNTIYELKKSGDEEYMKLDVAFQEQRKDEPIRIDASFERSRFAAISGFPMTLEVCTLYFFCELLSSGFTLTFLVLRR